MPGSAQTGEDERRAGSHGGVPPPPAETSPVWMTEFRNSGKIVGDIIAPPAWDVKP